ncbi:MAG TPA: hypothetical protein VKU01_03480 [Bryobacteraceae bacterium]|nr:hypothetical protein [Bryobacteraceae bacterium]
MRTIALLFTCTWAVHAGLQPERVAWDRTPEAFAGRHVVVGLKDGTKIDGHWAGITTDTFTMQVAKTSNHRAVGKGIQTLPRISIITLRVGKQHIRGRVVGSVVGFYGPALIGSAVQRSSEAIQSGWGVAAYAGAVIGFCLGRAVDHATHEVILVP